jgi:hypothetical protein
MSEKSFVTRQQIADDLGIDVKTLRRYLKKYDVKLKPGLVHVCKAVEIKEIFRNIRMSDS